VGKKYRMPTAKAKDGSALTVTKRLAQGNIKVNGVKHE
jgi:hypothetical protein